MTALEKVYRRTIQMGTADLGSGQGMDIWQWDEGVALYGFIKAYEKTNDPAILAFMKRWIDFHLDRMDFQMSINTTAPLLGVLKLLACEPGQKRYEAICRRFASWCLSEAPRADRGAFEHSCTVNTYDNEIWADTLFMGCLFLFKWGVYTGDDTYSKEAIRQFILHYNFLADDKTGLIYHGYDCNERAKKGVLWGRGNGWFAVASAEILALLPKDADGYNQILQNFKKHFQGVMDCRHESGAWHTVMDKPDTYLEMSATASFTYAMFKARELGLAEVSEQAARQSMECVAADIDDEGNVLHGSIGTCVMEDYIKYNDIGFGYSYFTQGLAMMALSYE